MEEGGGVIGIGASDVRPSSATAVVTSGSTSGWIDGRGEEWIAPQMVDPVPLPLPALDGKGHATSRLRCCCRR